MKKQTLVASHRLYFIDRMKAVCVFINSVLHEYGTALNKSLLRLNLTLIVILSGCSSVPLEPNVYPDDPAYAPVTASALRIPSEQTGSLYEPRYSLGLYTDQQARRVGDIITIIFDEQYQSSKSAETVSDKSSANTLGVTNLLGSVPSAGSLSLNAQTGNDRAFAGKGEADRSNSLRGQISVSVSEILPNGILKIRGERWLTLSEGDEYIRITGIIRPQDINPNNTVTSSKVADARISFGGRGSLNNATKQGWGDRIFNSPWWPF